MTADLGVRRALDARMCRADQRWWGTIAGLALTSAALLTLARLLDREARQ